MRTVLYSAIVSTVMLLSAFVVTPAQAAPLEGGGCNDFSSNGWAIGVCSSERDGRAYGDIYVNARGSLGSSCYIIYRLKEKPANTVVAFSGQHSCYSGHHPNIWAPLVSGKRYFNEAIVYVNGINTAGGYSPDVW